MATLIDPVEADEVSNVEEPVQEEVTTSEGEAELAPMYQGKTIAEVAKMHQEAESRLGSQGAEVGELRKVVDNFILKQSETKAPEPAEEIDFFADPDKAVESKIANHPAIKEAQENTLRIRQDQAKQELINKHPDAQEIIQSPDFINWVKSDEIRVELLTRADQQYDSRAADNLFSQWKQIKQMSQTAVQDEKDARKDVVKKASTGGAKGSSETPSKKIYRRADIIELMKTDPRRYQSMEPEIRKAYAEKRVR
tara:strand:+ start:194 stop:952 length:759 start_codon:yes stop_codon:yes gene_type:complete